PAAVRVDAGAAAARLGDALGRGLSGDARRIAAAAADRTGERRAVRLAARGAPVPGVAAVFHLRGAHERGAVPRADPSRRRTGGDGAGPPAKGACHGGKLTLLLRAAGWASPTAPIRQGGPKPTRREACRGQGASRCRPRLASSISRSASR